MFFTDDFYGHRRILADYVGRASAPPIMAHMQHGWNPNDGFGRRWLEGREKKTHLPTLVWSEHNREFAESLGTPRVVAVGAPYVYLQLMLQGAEAPRHVGTGTIVYPLHAGHGIAPVRTGEEQFIEEVRERETGPVTMCLYWREFDDPTIRGRYEDAGFSVVTHGPREHPLFLLRQREMMLRHARVVTNRVSTAMWYAGLAGREIEVYGPVFGSGSAEETAWWEETQRRRWPEIMGTALKGPDAFELSGLELGAEQVREPAELAHLLGWDGALRTVGPVVEGAARARRRLTTRPR